MDDIDFSVFLTQQAGVAAIPITVFCESTPGTHIIRFCFAKHDDTLRLAAGKLRNL
jgi:methionine aminotransferase